jgi:uncharacterized protein
MKNLVTDIVIALVDFPDDVNVVEIKGAQSTILELHVAKADVGKVIGKQGHTANAIRTILAGISAKNRMNHILEIVEEQKTGPFQRRGVGKVLPD